MVGRGVQSVEVEPAVLGFRPFGDLVSHRGEDVDHPVDHQRERMAAAERSTGGGHGDVDGFLDENAGVAFGAELGERRSNASLMADVNAFRRLPGSARSGPGSDPSERRARLSGAARPLT